MTTAKDLIVSARRRIRIHAEEEEMEGYELKNGFRALKSMLGQWVLEESIKSFTVATVTDDVILTIYDDTTLQDEVEQALFTNLALRIGSDANVPADQVTVLEAASGKREILRRHFNAQFDDTDFDNDLPILPSQRYYSR